MKRSSSKKKSKQEKGKGKKGDDSEKLAVGAGWTIAAIQKFLECETDEQRLQQIFLMFSVNKDQYVHDTRITTSIDMHYANALWCIENGLDQLQMQFVCRTMDKLLQTAAQKSSQESEKPHFEDLRTELFEQFHTAFNEATAAETQLPPEMAKKIVTYFQQVFFRPLRLLIYASTHNRAVIHVPVKRRVFTPITPISLEECEEVIPQVDESVAFKPLVLPKTQIALEDARELIQQYTDNMVDTINRRYDILTDMITKLQPQEAK